MERYIKQLIEDLELIAKKPIQAPYFETPSHLEEAPDIAELALVPFKSIEEWTGIKQEVFPEIIQLQGDQWERVNEAIFKVFDSLNIQLIDAPPDIPPEILYEVLTTNWDHPVQYLPSSGMDLELCTGDPMTCPYGEYCDCGEEFDEKEIPHRFNEVIPQIAENIDAGFVCYLNTDTMEMENVPGHLFNDPEIFDAFTGEPVLREEWDFTNWNNCFVFNTLEPHETFEIMEQFTMKLEDNKLTEKLMYAMNQQKPSAKFKRLIDNSACREDWYSFKKQWLEKHIKELIFDEINSDFSFNPEDINGLFNDDGTKIDPETVPVPGLCIICRKYQIDDWEENLLCALNRNDQRNEPDFKCGAFEKI